jgi:hypothetical protein
MLAVVLRRGKFENAARIAGCGKLLYSLPRSCLAWLSGRATLSNGHVAEWLRNGLQNRLIRVLPQWAFRKIVEMTPQCHQ